MSEKSKSEDWEKVEKVLGEPIFDDFPENTLRIRRNLLIVSFLTLAYKLNDLSISADSSLLGVKFDGLTNDVVEQTLFWLILYHLIHFAWNSVVHLQHWRLRITGTRLSYTTAGMMTSEDGDYPDDPRQSTLYGWWSRQARKIGAIGREAESLKEKVLAWEKRFEKLSSPSETANLSTTLQTLSEINRNAVNLVRKVESVDKILSSCRIPVSLERFNTWFKLFQFNQIIKWFLIELFIPLALGIVAIWIVIPQFGAWGWG